MNYAHTSSGLRSPHRIRSATAMLLSEIEMQLGAEAGRDWERKFGQLEEALCPQTNGGQIELLFDDGRALPV